MIRRVKVLVRMLTRVEYTGEAVFRTPKSAKDRSDGELYTPHRVLTLRDDTGRMQFVDSKTGTMVKSLIGSTRHCDDANKAGINAHHGHGCSQVHDGHVDKGKGRARDIGETRDCKIARFR